MTTIEQYKQRQRAELRQIAAREVQKLGRFLVYSCAAVTTFGSLTSLAELAAGNTDTAAAVAKDTIISGLGIIGGGTVVLVGNNLEIGNQTGEFNPPLDNSTITE